ncbi:hypothetical protein [Radiobacillus sp. PE A8.2]|uniref:hypothetical protein n=1 Tax=Radiobacillus sp. PE A8.2 TaxID=3380349 RepID=UPI00388F6357
MRELEGDILTKMEIIELKREVVSILHSIQFDCCYNIENCIIDLHKLLSQLDVIEFPQNIIMNLNKDSLTKDAIRKGLETKSQK